MPYQPYNPIDAWKKEQERQIDIVNKIMQEQLENQDIMEYKDTIFKDMANDIISSQNEIEKKLDTMISDSAKSEKKSRCIAIWTLIFTFLGLLVAIAGIIVQFL